MSGSAHQVYNVTVPKNEHTYDNGGGVFKSGLCDHMIKMVSMNIIP